MEDSQSKGDADLVAQEKDGGGGETTPATTGESLTTNRNMISNLPLLFANGYPISLQKITDRQLEKFIPFMVQCSLGHVQTSPGAQSPDDLPQTPPSWWPDDVPFSMNLSERPASYSEEDWSRKLKELVCVCYEYHNNLFLLRFCTVLSNYEPECLRFINNYNSTTSIYDRFNNKLLVTFRNENMLYDKQYNANRICLLPRRKSHAVSSMDGGGGGSGAMDGETELHPDDASRPLMVEPPLFDIYLCDYCDAELYSLEACREHERTCREADADSDVILCEDDDDDDVVAIQLDDDEDDASEASTIAGAVKLRNRKRFPAKKNRSKRTSSVQQQQRSSSHQRYDDLDLQQQSEDQEDGKVEFSATDEASSSCGPDEMQSFLMQHFQLMSTAQGAQRPPTGPQTPRKNGKLATARSPSKAFSSSSSVGAGNDKKRRNDRSMLTLNRCAVVPLTSPMGKFLLKRQKTMIHREYMLERMDRMERFCPAPIVKDSHSKPRWLTANGGGGDHSQVPVTYRPIDYRPLFAEDGQRFDSKYVHKYRPARRQFSQRSRDLAWLELTRVLLRSCRPCSVNMVRLTEGDIRMYFLNLAIEKKKRELLELQRADMMRMFMQQQRQLKRPAECIDLCSSSSGSEDEDEVDRIRLRAVNDVVDVLDSEPEAGGEAAKVVEEKKVTMGGPASKRMRVNEGETKENRVDGGTIAVGGGLAQLEGLVRGSEASEAAVAQRYVKILPKLGFSDNIKEDEAAPRNGLLQSPTKLLLERNHSAIQSQPIAYHHQAASPPQPIAMQAASTLMTLSPPPPLNAQLGVAWSVNAAAAAPLLVNNEVVGSALAPSIEIPVKLPTLQLVPMQQTPLVSQLTAAAVNSSSQSSYLFLPKQDVVYHQPLSTAISAESTGPAPHDNADPVLVGTETTTIKGVAERSKGNNNPSRPTEGFTNSTFNNLRSPAKTIVRRTSTSTHREAVNHSNVSQKILMPKPASVSSQEESQLPRSSSSSSNNNSGRSRAAHKSSLVQDSGGSRRAAVCDSFVGLPKKLPPLIIAPAAIGGK